MARKGQRLNRYTFAELDAIHIALTYYMSVRINPPEAFETALRKTKLRREREKERAK